MMKMNQGFFKSFKAYLPVIIVLIIVFAFFKFIIQVSFVPSESMCPTISKKTFILGSRLSTPQKGDIIIFKKKGVTLVKRIIANEGEIIKIKKGHYYINGKKEKINVKGKTLPNTETEYAVPRDCYFVSGDNREHSTDSRHWVDTYVKKSEVLSVVIWKGW